MSGEEYRKACVSHPGLQTPSKDHYIFGSQWHCHRAHSPAPLRETKAPCWLFFCHETYVSILEASLPPQHNSGGYLSVLPSQPPHSQWIGPHQAIPTPKGCLTLIRGCLGHPSSAPMGLTLKGF